MEGLIFGIIFYGNAVRSSPQIRESESRNPGNFCLWNPEYSSRNPESHQRLEFRIQVLLTNTGIRNPQRGIQNPRQSWIALHKAKTPLIDSAGYN